MLECTDLACIRNNRYLFSQLNFSTQQNLLTLVIGNNGSGKTSLLRLFAGLVPITHGNIKYNGKNIHDSNTYFTSLTYIGHKNFCNDNFTVLENIQLWANLKNTHELIAATICFFKLQPILDIKYKDLSSGWKRRVALSRLLIYNTNIWIIDEPFAHLDINTKELILELIFTRLKQKDSIVIISDHSEVKTYGECQVINLEAFKNQQSNSLQHDLYLY
ncbi:heme ABC exporter, ATP-binding protein CcmA [Ehrlichia chaffeensis str. Liberty]|uniref:Heme exporter protein CcmA n=1 Tax=Ehrlichia chaffeensis (strain ATCC CRL-10679 / Arkansas) TaxID=205920 RepID=Q2GHG7_EHRCR|nr:heme ABC exporter ATP-binding protein CcmA [Ehrlichia chaffeensis]ABD44980.1 putative heme exporter protein CcmA [Ehrlichia chaffeensis str. Arkansas]AHX05869.1 heme ABC exporter, ATP-binding protein CcmA [Ehrlichia chaffeensis str. Jax]AHX06860.1 heme ABC exporter, ATP-binding protein CcmA [Ehrlichia chaffeensis str. Liberty]AHX07779.1 heme ABC exporter, ATP-binding protein CcmA [Ehrlichia chaffeensis str. Osceola]AHX08840.1 heme ABC exporter, ATP-binding protein CcmA [Ehrlichia chaffeensi